MPTETERSRGTKIDLYRVAAPLKRALRFANILSLCGEIYGVEWSRVEGSGSVEVVAAAEENAVAPRWFPGKTFGTGKYTASRTIAPTPTAVAECQRLTM